jgi:ABC-type transport system involved in cytochrome c biogenesis permease subunit
VDRSRLLYLTYVLATIRRYALQRITQSIFSAPSRRAAPRALGESLAPRRRAKNALQSLPYLIIYIFRGLFSTSFDEMTAKALGRMMYRVICFVMLFSFVETILGGIWADQSWGRDPKENVSTGENLLIIF